MSQTEVPPDLSPRAATRQKHGEHDPELLAALMTMIEQGASDLHISANTAPLMRIDGKLKPVPGMPVWSRDRAAEALLSLMSPDQLERFETELEMDFSYSLGDHGRFRVNYYQEREAIGGAFRLIPTEILSLNQLGIPDAVGRFARMRRGLVLVTGPTGSGKSTTLASLIDMVNESRAEHIVTVEDPIEFLHNHKQSLINQREVGGDTHSFSNALKHVLRQDPDVILIGELRDLETISTALTAAETGHLVFATLHTQDAAQTVDRVIDVFPPHQQNQVRAQLATTLQGVVCQTLLPKVTGSGRTVAAEVMVMNTAIANLIREGKTYQIHSTMQAGTEYGMQTLDQHLAELVNEGVIDYQVASERANDRDGFEQLVRRVDAPSPMASGAIDFGDAFSGGVR